VSLVTVFRDEKNAVASRPLAASMGFAALNCARLNGRMRARLGVTKPSSSAGKCSTLFDRWRTQIPADHPKEKRPFRPPFFSRILVVA